MFIGFMPWDLFQLHCEDAHDIVCGNIGFCDATFCHEQNKKEHMKICHELNKLLLINIDAMTITKYEGFQPFDYKYRHYSSKQISNLPDDCLFIFCDKCESGCECRSSHDWEFATNHKYESHPYWCSFCGNYYVNPLDRLKHKCKCIKDGASVVQQQMKDKSSKRKKKSKNGHKKDDNGNKKDNKDNKKGKLPKEAQATEKGAKTKNSGKMEIS